MIRALVLAALMVTATAAQPGVAQAPQPLELPRIVTEPSCANTSANPDDIVVCGRSRPTERYRIPTDLRGRAQVDAHDESPVALQREVQSLERYSSQAVGPGGYLQASRQEDCEWRAARQELQGRQPDCTVRVHHDDPADWQRGRSTDPAPPSQ